MTSDELIDAQLDRSSVCYLCLKHVPADEGKRWQYFVKNQRRHLYLHDDCSKLVRSRFSRALRRKLDRLLADLRAMRGEA